MLNIFPNLLTYSLIAPFMLRLLLGAFVVFLSYKKIRSNSKPWTEGNKIEKISRGAHIVVAICGILLVFGLFTQIASLMILIIGLTSFLYKKRVEKSISEKDTVIHIFVIVIALSLMLSGAGLYAIDLPL